MAIYVNGNKVTGSVRVNGTTKNNVVVNGVTVRSKFQQVYTVSSTTYTTGTYTYKGTFLGFGGLGYEPDPNPVQIGGSHGSWYYIWDFYTVYNSAASGADRYKLVFEMTVPYGYAGNDITIENITVHSGYHGGVLILYPSDSTGYSGQGGILTFSTPINYELYGSGTITFSVTGYYGGPR